MHSDRFIKRVANVAHVADLLIRLGETDRGFCIARTFNVPHDGYVVWVMTKDGKEGIPFYDAKLEAAMEAGLRWAQTGEGWGW